MEVRRLRAIGLSVACWAASGFCASADEPVPNPILVDGLPPEQIGDDAALPLTPLRPIDAAAARRLDGVAWYATGQLRESRGDFRGALRAFRQALELDPGRLDILRAIVPLAFSLNEGEEGLRLALKLAERDPSDTNLLQQVARVLIAQGQVAQATKLLERAVASEAVPRKSALYVLLHRDLGVLYAAQGKTDPAAAAFAVLFDALQSPETYALSPRDRAALLADPETTYERLGGVFLSAGKSDLAVAAFEQAAAARRDRPGILQFNLARVYLKAGQPDKALAQLDEYVDAGRSDRGRAAYDLLGEALTALERQDEFTGRLEQIAAAEPKNQDVRLVLADRLLKGGRLDEAAALYEAAIAGKPDSSAYLGLAAVYRQRKVAGKLMDLLGKAAVAGASDDALREALAAIAADEKLTAAVFGAAAPQAAVGAAGIIVCHRLPAGKAGGSGRIDCRSRSLLRCGGRHRTEKGGRTGR